MADAHPAANDSPPPAPRRKYKPKGPPVNHSSEKAFLIATDIIIRCQSFLTELAFQNGPIDQLADDLGETMFIIDYHLKTAKLTGELTPIEYRLLSDLAETITDCAWCLCRKMHPFEAHLHVRRRGVSEFPPSKWTNRVSRMATVPFVSFPYPLLRDPKRGAR